MKSPRALPERRPHPLFALVFVIATGSSIFTFLLKIYLLVQTRSPPAQRSPSLFDSHVGQIAPIRTNTSIAFYTIAGASQKGVNPDLRGAFWEFQLPFFGGKYSLQYLSDGPLSVNGIDFLVLPNGSSAYQDSQFCIRTPESWSHFVNFNT
jgi:hypothetical protein